MAERRKSSRPAGPPATTPEARERQLIALAVDEAERQIAAGTASSQILTHFLKLATTREQLEQERLRHETALLHAKVESLASAANIEELYNNAIIAMRTYQGHPEEIAPDDQILQ